VNFTFTPGSSGMQVHNATATLKSTKVVETRSGIAVKVKFGSNENKTEIIYGSDMTAGLDPGYDIGMLSAGSAVEIYTSLVEDNGVNFARQALPLPDGEDDIIAVGVDTKAGGEVTFSADFLNDESYNIILEDRTTGTFTDLSTDTYRITLAAGTYGTGRFFIHTKAGTTTGTDPDPEMLDVRIWSYAKSINIQGVFNSKAKASVFSSQGSMIYDNFLTDNAFNTIDLPTASRGLYIVIVVDGDDVYKQKVMIL
ncbi:MAG: T9SS C-terminal target domain-containing protein, partial [Dehalococcoidia bacterium]